LICLEFFGQAQSCCSICDSFVKSLEKPWERVILEHSPDELLEAVSKQPVPRQHFAAKNLNKTKATLDTVAHKLAMNSQMLMHLKKSLRCNAVSPQTLGHQMRSFGCPLITSLQAKELLETLRGRNETDYKYYHVLCSRVVDPWNLNNRDHGIGHCYYGYLGILDHDTQIALAKLIGASDQETLAAVYWRLLCRRVDLTSSGWIWKETFNDENFWSKDDLAFIKEDMCEKGVADPMDVVITCQFCADTCSVKCTTVAGNEIGQFKVPAHEDDPFGPWLYQSIIQTGGAIGGFGRRLCLMKVDGVVFWREDMLSPFEIVCRRLGKFEILETKI